MDVFTKPRDVYSLHNYGNSCGNQNQQNFRQAPHAHPSQRGYDLVPPDFVQSIQYCLNLPRFLQLVFAESLR